jgi:hypothetical protein
MQLTANLELPYIMPSQAQKHVTHNEALRMLDAIVQLSVLDRDRNEPPGTPGEGDSHIVAAGAAGAWEGREGHVAAWQDGGWTFLPPRAGWLCWVAADGEMRVWKDGDWVPLQAGASELQDITRLGIGTSADETNIVSAKLNNALWSARFAGEGGTGDLRYTMNKEGAANVLSLLMQSGWNGRAELGLVGDDDLHLRVSADGDTWRDGMVIDAATGRASFPYGIAGRRELLSAPRTYHVRPDGNDGNDGLSDMAGGAFATLQKAADVVFGSLDLGSHDVVIQVGDGTYSAGVTVSAPRLGTGMVTFRGNAGSPGNVVISVAGDGCFQADGAASFAVEDMELRTAGGGHCLTALGGAQIRFANLRFGPAAGAHMRAELAGMVEATGDYQIVGGATQHHNCGLGGFLRVTGRAVTLTGTPAFTTFAAAATGSQLNLIGNTYTGAATGKRYVAALNAVIVAGGAAYLPGSISGEVSSGGQYT